MRKKNLLCALAGFLMVLIAAYFGASIHNAKSTDLVRYLDEMDHIYNHSVDMIPRLNHKAAVFTIPFILIILVVELIISFKSTVRQVRNIAIGLTVAVLIVGVFAILTLFNPFFFDFSQWGYVWITMGVFIIAGNAISIFIKGNT